MTRFAEGAFRPAPGRAPLGSMLLAQTRAETRLVLRHPEQLLLNLLIPMALLVGLSLLPLLSLPEPRVDSVTPRILALAVMSSAFTGQAIALGFDRRYGVIKRLAATALPRWLLVVGRVSAALIVVAAQLVVLGVLAALLGWQPAASGLLAAVVLVVLGTLAFGALGVLLGGALRAEVVLALANVVWFALLLAGGIIVPLDQLPDGLAAVVGWLPSGALAQGLDSVLTLGGWPGWQSLVVLVAWGAGAGLLAARTTKLA
ncbi:ABC transporter permease [Allokutzneria multivorans]|uniref:ABC transporter permease n=1 Tax=Allokutzneria multivorans TaxID=1142134 RepID=A0ABP7U3F8_9PSEU